MLSRLALRSVQSYRPLSVAIRGSADGVRDEVNFPRPVRNAEPGKVRLAFIPEEWFTFFHKKTGVTGPYMFGVAFTTYLVSKEFIVWEHEIKGGVGLLIMIAYVHKKFGKQISEYVTKGIDKIETDYMQSRVDTEKELKEAIQHEKTEQWRAEGETLLMEAKKENILLQLEAAYRERLVNTYKEVKRRLDYQVEKQNIDRRIAQKHMSEWIINNVIKSITPEQEKETLNRCIADLGLLAAKR